MGFWHHLSTTVIHISSSFRPGISNRQRIEQQMLAHLIGIGIEAHSCVWNAENIRRREGNEKVILRKLANFDVRLNGITSIEVWREIRKQGRVSLTREEMSYIVTFEPGITLLRIPILTRATVTRATGERALQWTAFTWGKLPLLVERFKADEKLNRKLRDLFDANLLSELRIRALSSMQVDIISDYHPQRLPPRELIECIEAIAGHVIAYVAEQNRSRDEREEMVRMKLFGRDER